MSVERSYPGQWAEAVGAALGESVRSWAPVTGGDICDAWRAETAAGPVFVKTHAQAPPGLFNMEAAGLRWMDAALAEAGEAGAGVPEVLAHGDGFLALPWIEPGRPTPASYEDLGRALAVLHRAGADGFGGLPPGSPKSLFSYLGDVPVDARPTASWAEFLLTRRWEPLARRAVERGALDPAAIGLIDRLGARLEELGGSAEPAARVHGDLWSGNVRWGSDGRGWLIDPAAHGDHREADLAMARLFGGFSERMFVAYDEAFPLAAGWEDRVDVHQVVPLLVHAVLFGPSWGARALRALRSQVG